jgi:mannose/fructose-specific phosphotransferase system component IIA
MSSPRALLAGHGDFAAGLASAVAQISGRADVFTLVSNRDKDAEQIEDVIREVLDANDISVVFTDLPAGSATFAARRLQRERPNLVLVTGVNLATLLDFVFAADADDDDPHAVAARAAAHAAERGRGALAVVPARGSTGGSSGGARGAA